jgi:hypothetical protein
MAAQKPSSVSLHKNVVAMGMYYTLAKKGWFQVLLFTPHPYDYV